MIPEREEGSAGPSRGQWICCGDKDANSKGCQATCVNYFEASADAAVEEPPTPPDRFIRKPDEHCRPQDCLHKAMHPATALLHGTPRHEGHEGKGEDGEEKLTSEDRLWGQRRNRSPRCRPGSSSSSSSSSS